MEMSGLEAFESVLERLLAAREEIATSTARTAEQRNEMAEKDRLLTAQSGEIITHKAAIVQTQKTIEEFVEVSEALLRCLKIDPNSVVSVTLDAPTETIARAIGALRSLVNKNADEPF